MNNQCNLNLSENITLIISTKYSQTQENKVVHHLMQQFKTEIKKQSKNQPICTLQLYSDQPAAMYQNNIKTKFVEECRRHGWEVLHITVHECIYIVTVRPIR